jgi:hypothetical protein
VFIGEALHGFEFDNQTVFNKEIGKIFPEGSAVFIKDIERMLLKSMEILFSQAVGKSILVNLFKVSMPQVSVEVKGCLSNDVTELKYWVFHRDYFSRKEAQKAQKMQVKMCGYRRVGFQGFAGGWAAAQPRADDAAAPTNMFADSAPSPALLTPACVRAEHRREALRQRFRNGLPTLADATVCRPRIPARAKRCARMEGGVQDLRKKAGKCR